LNKEKSVLVLTPPARSVCIQTMCKTFALHASGPTSKKKSAGQNYFLFPCFHLRLWLRQILFWKKRILFWKMNAKKLYFRVQQQNNEKTTENFRKNQEVAAMQVELWIAYKGFFLIEDFFEKTPLSTYISNQAMHQNEIIMRLWN